MMLGGMKPPLTTSGVGPTKRLDARRFIRTAVVSRALRQRRVEERRSRSRGRRRPAAEGGGQRADVRRHLVEGRAALGAVPKPELVVASARKPSASSLRRGGPWVGDQKGLASAQLGERLRG